MKVMKTKEKRIKLFVDSAIFAGAAIGGVAMCYGAFANASAGQGFIAMGLLYLAKVLLLDAEHSPSLAARYKRIWKVVSLYVFITFAPSRREMRGAHPGR